MNIAAQSEAVNVHKSVAACGHIASVSCFRDVGLRKPVHSTLCSQLSGADMMTGAEVIGQGYCCRYTIVTVLLYIIDSVGWQVCLVLSVVIVGLKKGTPLL